MVECSVEARVIFVQFEGDPPAQIGYKGSAKRWISAITIATLAAGGDNCCLAGRARSKVKLRQLYKGVVQLVRALVSKTRYLGPNPSPLAIWELVPRVSLKSLSSVRLVGNVWRESNNRDGRYILSKNIFY